MESTLQKCLLLLSEKQKKKKEEQEKRTEKKKIKRPEIKVLPLESTLGKDSTEGNKCVYIYIYLLVVVR